MGVSRKLRLLQKTARAPLKGLEAGISEAALKVVRLFESSCEPAIVTDDEDQIIHINPAAENFLGYTSSELSGESLGSHIKIKSKSHRGGSSRLTAVEKKSLAELEVTGKRRDGERFTAGASKLRIDTAAKSLNIITFETGQTERPSKGNNVLEAILTDAPLGYHALDENGMVIDVNRSWLSSMGYEESDVLGRPFEEFLLPEHSKQFRRGFPELKSKGEFRDVELKMMRKDGEVIDANFECRPEYDPDGNYVRTHCMFHDVTEKRRAEAALRASEDLYRSTIDSMADLIHVVDRDLRITLVNQTFKKWCRELEIPGAAVGKTVFDLFPFLAKRVRQEYRQVFEEGRILVTLESNEIGGRKYTTETRKIPVMDDGRVARVMTIVRDITELKEAETALQRREQEISSVFAAAPVGIGLTVNRVIKQVNERMCRMLGYTADELIDQGARMVYPTEEEYDRVGREKYQQIRRDGIGSIETRWRCKDGRIIDVLLSSTPLDRDDLSKGVTFTALDITERKLAEEALKESEQRFRTVADLTYDWEYWLGADGECLYVSPSCETTIGYGAEEFKNNFGILRQITCPDDLPILDRHLAEDSEPGKVTSIDFRITTREGEQRWINHVCQAVFDENGVYLGRRASNRDITDRKMAEEGLRRERDRAQRYLDVAGTMLLAINNDERVVLINRKGCQILGMDELEIIGKNWFECFVPPGKREEVRTVFHTLFNGDVDSLEYFESPVRSRQGEEKMIAWYNTVIRDEDGQVTATLSSGSNITERKRMEKVQAALFEISEATNMAASLEDLLKTIHQILGTLIDTTNFYVALYDAGTDRYTFPYLVDQYHASADVPPERLKKTLTDYVRRTGLPLLANETTDRELRESGEVEVVGEPSQIWLGVPLKTSSGVIGVVAVQSYTDADLYQERDMDLMTFVSRHISMAIERKLAEEALRESEEHFRRLVETMSEGLIERDNSNVITFANNRFCELLGYPVDRIVGSKLSDFMDYENWRIMNEQLASRSVGETDSYEIEWICCDGSRVTTIMSPELVRDSSGKIVGSFAVITDISDRKRAEDKLRQATTLLRTEREALTQKNIALKEILDHIEKERQDYKQTICKDVEQAVSPLIGRLKALADGNRVKEFESLHMQLQAILAKDIDAFRDRYARLTPREIEICELIKGNMSSKEISERLNLSLLTVHKHREQIRKKLGITSKGINLSTYLQSH